MTGLTWLHLLASLVFACAAAVVAVFFWAIWEWTRPPR